MESDPRNPDSSMDEIIDDLQFESHPVYVSDISNQYIDFAVKLKEAIQQTKNLQEAESIVDDISLDDINTESESTEVHDGKYVIDYLQTQNITHIDYLITTHAHWDHIGGANEIINKYENELDGIDYILNTGVPHTSKTYQNYINRIDSFRGKQIKIREDDKLDIDNELDIKIINPESDINNELSLNDNSLVLHIKHKDTSIILPSDIEEYSEKRLINKYGDTLNADIYKVGHHGNNSSTSYEFIKQINPDISLISSSYHSQFSHPHDSVINTLSDFSKSTYWTGVHGSIIAVSDGKNWNIYPQMKKTTIPSKIKNEKQVNCAPDAGFEI